MHLALNGLFRAKWPADVQRTRMLMDEHAVDALVTAYEDLIPALRLPDPNDRHVLAAAIRGQANVIVNDEPARLSIRCPRTLGNRGAASRRIRPSSSGSCP